MRRRLRPIGWLGPALLAAGMLATPAGSALAQADDPPNFVLILTDDQGWGTLSMPYDPQRPKSASDYFATPHINELARSGTRFTQAYAPHPNCSPSRASIQLGRSPAALRFTDISHRNSGPLYEGNKLNPPRHVSDLPESGTTIPELLKKHDGDYKAAHFGKWHMAGGGPSAHGYDASDGANAFEGKTAPDNPKDAFGITRRATQWMKKQARQDRPFYLQLSHYAVHKPIRYREQTLENFKERTPGERHTNAAYGAMLYDMDEAIGQFLDNLEKLGLRENTYIIFTSDNGTYPTDDPGNINGPVRGYKATVWEGGVRVPFIVDGPDIPAGRVSREPVVGYDILPTIADLAGIDDSPKKVEGGSLAPLLRSEGDSADIDRPYDGLIFHWPHYQLAKRSTPDTTFLRDGWKLHYWWETGETSLFHLTEDLDESNELSGQRPAKTRNLRLALFNRLHALDAQLPTPNEDWGANLAALDRPIDQYLLFDLAPGDVLFASDEPVTERRMMSAERERGFTFQVEIEPAAADVESGRIVPLIELGGSLNGSGLYLVDGRAVFLAKQDSKEKQAPQSLSDRSFRDDGTLAMTHPAGELEAGRNYRIAVSYTPPDRDAGEARVRFRVAGGNSQPSGHTRSVAGTRPGADWSGNERLSIATLPEDRARLGGYTKGASDEPLKSLDVRAFQGTLRRAFYWNQSQ